LGHAPVLADGQFGLQVRQGGVQIAGDEEGGGVVVEKFVLGQPEQDRGVGSGDHHEGVVSVFVEGRHGQYPGGGGRARTGQAQHLSGEGVEPGSVAQLRLRRFRGGRDREPRHARSGRQAVPEGVADRRQGREQQAEEQDRLQ